jgi:hypothetical protein
MKNIFYSNAKNIKLRNNYIKKVKTDDKFKGVDDSYEEPVFPPVLVMMENI